ncbi:reverse transcriptase domain-containing protein [Tanacetum coccineum]
MPRYHESHSYDSIEHNPGHDNVCSDSDLPHLILPEGGGRTRGRSGDQGNGRIDGQGGQVGGQGSKVNDGVDEVPGFSTIIAQQLQNLLPAIIAQVSSQGSDQGNGRNQNSDAVNDNIRGDVRNVIENNDCMSWEDFKTLNREEFCLSNEMQKLKTELWNHAMVGASHVAYTDPRGGGSNGEQTYKRLCNCWPLDDESLRNGSIKKNPEKRGNGGEPSKDRNGRDDNKRTRTGNAFATTANPVRREYIGTAHKCTTCNFHHPPETPFRACFNCNRPGHFAKDYRVVPRNVNPINARNPTSRACYECGSTDHIKEACPRLNQAQRLGENHQN